MVEPQFSSGAWRLSVYSPALPFTGFRKLLPAASAMAEAVQSWRWAESVKFDAKHLGLADEVLYVAVVSVLIQL